MLERLVKEKEETENIYETKLQELQREFSAVQRQMEEELIKSTNIKQEVKSSNTNCFAREFCDMGISLWSDLFCVLTLSLFPCLKHFEASVPTYLFAYCPFISFSCKQANKTIVSYRRIVC